MADSEHSDDLHADLTHRIIGAAIRVHRFLGPGLLESAYEHCLARELALSGVAFDRQAEVPIIYRGAPLKVGFRMDLLVEEEVIVELKSVAKLMPIDEAQLLTYMRLAEKRVGLLINFNVLRLQDGLKRFVK